MALLFDDTALFDDGKKRFVDFNLPGTGLKLWEQFFHVPNWIIITESLLVIHPYYGARLQLSSYSFPVQFWPVYFIIHFKKWPNGKRKKSNN